MKSKTFSRIFTTASALFATALAAHAVTFTWDGGGADTKASTPANWVGDAVPTPAGFDIIFSGTSAIGTSVNWDYAQNFKSLTFDSAALAYTIGGATPIQFVTPAINALNNNSANTQIITSQINVFFNGSKGFNANTANLTLSGVTFRADSMSAGQTNTLTLTGASNGYIGSAINTSGTFTNLATGLRNSVVKTGAGTWELAGANTYGGLTNVQAGTLTLSGNRTTAMAGGITLGGGGAVAQTLNIQNGNFSLGGSFTVGNGGSTSIVNHTAGTIAATGGSQILLGNGDGNSTYNLSGGALSGLIRMGVNNAPTASVNVFDLSGGTLTTSGLQIGRTDGAGAFNTTNTFKQTAGTATVTNLSMGGATADAALTSNISGTLNLTGGTFTATTFSSLSAAGGSTSAITIGGTADVTLGAFPTNTFGTGSTATITFDGGTLKPAAASTVYMGGLTNAFVTANGAKFDVATGRDITVSQVLENAVANVGTLTKLGVGVLTLSGNNSYSGVTTISGGTLRIGAGSTTGTLGSGSVTNNSVLTFNRSDAITVANAISGTGTIYQTGAGATTLDPGAGSYSIRALSADGGNLILKSGTFATTGSDPFNGAYNVGAGARGGLLTIDGATLNIGGSKALKVGAAANGNLDIKSGVVTASDLVLGHNGSSVGTQSGGDVTITNLSHQDGGSGSSYTLTGGSLTANRIFNNTATAADFTFNLNGGTLKSGAGTTNLIDEAGRGGAEITVLLGTGNTIIDTTASSAAIIRPLGDMPSVAGAFTKAGDNSLTLTETSSYTGATTVNGGTLVINGSISTSILTTVNSGATLGGIGTVGTASVLANGTLAPGNSIGTLNFSDTLGLAGISDFEINPLLGLGLNADRANVTNGVTYGGTLNVLYGGASSDFAGGMIFNLFDASSFSGAFSTVNLPSLTGGLTWQNDLATNGSLSVIPEPNVAMLVGGLGMLALLRRRRHVLK